MLMHPYLNVPYKPRLKHFLGGFDVYDREESLGAELSDYDPDCPSDRLSLIYKFIVKRFAGLSYRHKFVLVAVLGESLAGETSKLFEAFEHDPFSHTLLPSGWNEITDPRIFFEHVYIVLSEVWVDELNLASQEDSTTW